MTSDNEVFRCFIADVIVNKIAGKYNTKEAVQELAALINGDGRVYNLLRDFCWGNPQTLMYSWDMANFLSYTSNDVLLNRFKSYYKITENDIS